MIMTNSYSVKFLRESKVDLDPIDRIILDWSKLDENDETLSVSDIEKISQEECETFLHKTNWKIDNCTNSIFLNKVGENLKYKSFLYTILSKAKEHQHKDTFLSNLRLELKKQFNTTLVKSFYTRAEQLKIPFDKISSIIAKHIKIDGRNFMLGNGYLAVRTFLMVKEALLINESLKLGKIKDVHARELFPNFETIGKKMVSMIENNSISFRFGDERLAEFGLAQYTRETKCIEIYSQKIYNDKYYSILFHEMVHAYQYETKDERTISFYEADAYFLQRVFSKLIKQTNNTKLATTSNMDTFLQDAIKNYSQWGESFQDIRNHPEKKKLIETCAKADLALSKLMSFNSTEQILEKHANEYLKTGKLSKSYYNNFTLQYSLRNIFTNIRIIHERVRTDIKTKLALALNYNVFYNNKTTANESLDDLYENLESISWPDYQNTFDKMIKNKKGIGPANQETLITFYKEIYHLSWQTLFFTIYETNDAKLALKKFKDFFGPKLLEYDCIQLGKCPEQ